MILSLYIPNLEFNLDKIKNAILKSMKFRRKSINQNISNDISINISNISK